MTAWDEFGIELFVADVDTSIRFYEDVVDFQLVRRDDGYASLRRGDAVLGLGPIQK
jgi:catechol 2,3-dioxygenase-like lactoylglutathione lyase family enzyme